jgi:16S rRNA (uracil1498-N3)-methyltransferase
MDGDRFQMSKFFIKKEDINGEIVYITGDNVNHIKNVLRMKKGEKITVNDSEGTDYYVELTEIKDDCIISKILTSDSSFTEPAIEVTLYQGIPKSDKMDYIIQKSVELGISKIIPVMTERTVVKFSNEKDMDKKRARWQTQNRRYNR